MAKKTQAGTNVAKVKQQNAAAGAGQFGTEFASETNAQEVRQQNQQSQGKAQGKSSSITKTKRAFFFGRVPSLCL